MFRQIGKLLRARKKWGRCHVDGHGQRCEVSKDIHDTAIKRSTEKQEWKAELKMETEEK